MNIHRWAYVVNTAQESTIESGSTDPEEIRALVADVYRCAPEQVTVRRVN